MYLRYEYSGGGAGGEAQTVQSLKHTGVGQMGHAVHVLLGVEAVADLVLVSLPVLRQGAEHQHAVDGIVGVDLIDDRENVFLGSIRRQFKLLDIHTHQLGALIDGYEQFRSFDRRELALIEPLRTLRLIHYSAWLARRWQDPIFPVNFPWFGSSDYWRGQVDMLHEQIEAMQEEPLVA